MKFIVIILLLFSLEAYADPGGCVVYKVKYVLKNGSSHTGLLPLYGYEDYGYLNDQTKTNRYCNDKEFQKLINDVFYKQQKKLTFKIYTEIHLVNFGKSVKQAGSAYPMKFAFADSSTTVQLNLDSIKYTVFLSARPADWEYSSVPIQIVDRKTSLMMQQNEVINYTMLEHPPVPESPGSIYDYNFETYFVVNYNKNISLHELINEVDNISEKIFQPEIKFISSKHKNKSQILEKEKRRTVIQIIDELRKKDIILIQVFPSC